MIDFTEVSQVLSKVISEKVADDLALYNSPEYRQHMSNFIYGGRRYYFTDKYLLSLPALCWKRCNSEEYNHVYGIGIKWTPVIKIGKIRHQNPYWMSKKEVEEYVSKDSRKNSENEKSDTQAHNVS